MEGVGVVVMEVVVLGDGQPLERKRKGVSGKTHYLFLTRTK